MRHATRNTAGLLLLLGLCGCVPIALPPVQGRIAGGIDDEAQAMADWRVGVYPAQLVPAAFRRSWMIGAGYVGRSNRPLTTGHGVFGEAGYVRSRNTGDGRARRLSVTLAPELIKRDDFTSWGRGATLTVGHDWVRLVDNKGTHDEGRVLLGWSHGEGGFGLHASVGVEHYPERTLILGMVGARLTIPAIFALLFAPELLTGLAN